MSSNNSLIIYSLIFVSFILTNSCVDDLVKINIDPNTSEKINPDFLFTNALLSTFTAKTSMTNSVAQVSRFNLMQQLQQEATYNILTSPGDRYNSEGYVRYIWNLYYPNCVNQIKSVINEVDSDPELVNKYAIARIWQVYIFHRLTDLYGDIPYFEAAHGEKGNLQPKYDLQSDIYNDFFNELDESIDLFDSSKPSFGSSDLLFGGSINQWRKFAYSLMLRLGMRLSEVDADTGSAWVNKAANSNELIEDENDIAYIQFYDGSLESNRNPFSDHWLELDYINPQDPNNVQGSKISKKFIDELKGDSRSTKDPRLNVIAVVWIKSNTGIYVKDTSTNLQLGMENGKYDSYPSDYENFSEPNPNTVMSYSAPVIVMTPAEVNFLLLEASIRGWINDLDNTLLYSNGVSAAMRQWSLYGAEGTISEKAITSYITANPFKKSASFEEQLEQISRQKWILFYTDQIENFSNWRRTNYPQLTPVNYPGNLTGGEIPRRFIVPESEELYNKENFLIARDRQSGNNTLLSRVWWDVN